MGDYHELIAAAVGKARRGKASPIPDSISHLFEPYQPRPSEIKPFIVPPCSQYRRQQSRLRRQLHDALSGLCGICGGALSSSQGVTIDHVVPRSRGGGDYRNVVPAHSACNGAKADRLPTGCELIMLAAVNAVLESTDIWKAGPDSSASPFAVLAPLLSPQTKGPQPWIGISCWN